MGGKGSGLPKASIIKLDGSINSSGKIERTDFFNFLNMDLSDYSNVELTAEEATTFKNTVMRLKYGVSAAIPLLCSGPKCLHQICPFHTSKKYPLTKQCPVEFRLIQTLTQGYIEDLGVDPDNASEMTLVNKLVECDIIELRANSGLSGGNDEEAGTLLKTIISESDNGTHKEEVKLHPLLEAKEKMTRIKMNILDAFVATRREKYKKAAATKTDDNLDASQVLSQLKKAQELTIRTKEANDKAVIDADWSTSDL